MFLKKIEKICLFFAKKSVFTNIYEGNWVMYSLESYCTTKSQGSDFECIHISVDANLKEKKNETRQNKNKCSLSY